MSHPLVAQEIGGLSQRVFAFGSNMCSGRFHDYGVSPEGPGRAAVLPGYRLQFNKKSTEDKSGKANVAPHEGSEVWGVLYSISDNDLNKLDEGEGGYRVTPDGQELKPKQQSVNLGEKISMTETQAKQKLKAHVRSLQGTTGNPKMAVSLRDFVTEKYIPSYLSKKKPMTRRVHQVLLNHHILAALGDRELAEIDFDQVQDFIDRKRKSGLSWDSVRDLKKVVSSVFSFAVRNYGLPANPVRNVELGPKPPNNNWKLASPEQLEALVKDLPLQRATMVWLLWVTGMRIGELQALKWEWMDWANKTLRVCATWDEHAKDPMKRYHSTKSTFSNRTIVLDGRDLDWLQKYRATCRKMAEADFIFASRTGDPVRAGNALRRILRPAASKVGIPDFDWHYLRHWFCSYQAAKGTTVEVLHKRLGHRDIRTTLQYYLHVPDARAREAARVASNLVSVSFEEVACGGLHGLPGFRVTGRKSVNSVTLTVTKTRTMAGASS